LVTEYLQVDAYRGELLIAPQKKGYVFVGWYVDQELTQPLSKQTNSGFAYAVFADELTASVKCQLSEGTSDESLYADLRLLTGVCSVKPKSVVFFIDDAACAANALYGQLSYEDTPADQLFGASAKYIASYTIENIPRERFCDELTVVPGWYTWDGTFVMGTPRTVSVSDGLI
jgi:hypothetical protein